MNPAVSVFLRYLFALVLCAAVAGLLWPWRDWLDPANTVMLFLLAVFIAALKLGRGPAVAAAFASVILFDVLFVPPHFSLSVADAQYFVVFAVMLAVGLITTHLTTQLAERQAAVQAHALEVEAEKLRAAILASLSHDLRTPLTSLVGLADTLHADLAVQNVGAGETAGIIRDQAQAMHRMVTNLLDMARLQSGRVQLDRQWQPIDEVVGSSLRLLADVLAGRHVAVDLPADLPLVLIDAVLVERVLCNLLENAVKHSAPGAGIRLSACVTGEVLQVAVCNEGGGFPLQDTAALFDPFVRGEGTLAPGAGIGLAVCRTIVLAHGGDIAAENQTGGACVRFSLPLGTPPEMEGEPA